MIKYVAQSGIPTCAFSSVLELDFPRCSDCLTCPRVISRLINIDLNLLATISQIPPRHMDPPHNSSRSSSNSSKTGKSPASQRSGLTNTPQLLPHSKYRLPLTDPSFLPVGSSSVTPIQAPMPGISGTRPVKLTVPLRASDSGRRRTRLPIARPVWGEKRVSLLVSARRVKFDDAGEGVRVASEMRHWAAR